MSRAVTVSQLFIYPLKSTRGIARTRVRVMSCGFEWDRQWMLINTNGVFLSQRSHPQLARIVPRLTRSALVLRAPQLPALTVPFGRDGERVAVRVHADACAGIDQGDEAAAWAARIAGEPVRLVRVPPEPARVANPKFAGDVAAPMGFADGFPVLVCSQASLDDLNSRMPRSVPMNRFRPNVVLKGLPAWAEDQIESIAVGDLVLRLVKPCTRCTIPSVDQRRGVVSTDPAPVLRTFRLDRALRGITFGENAVIAAGAGCELERGAKCRVTFEGSLARA